MPGKPSPGQPFGLSAAWKATDEAHKLLHVAAEYLQAEELAGTLPSDLLDTSRLALQAVALQRRTIERARSAGLRGEG